MHVGLAAVNQVARDFLSLSGYLLEFVLVNGLQVLMFVLIQIHVEGKL